MSDIQTEQPEDDRQLQDRANEPTPVAPRRLSKEDNANLQLAKKTFEIARLNYELFVRNIYLGNKLSFNDSIAEDGTILSK